MPEAIDSLPAVGRILLAVAITVTITVAAAAAFRPRIVSLREANQGQGTLPDLVEAVTTFMIIAFIFLVAFTMNQFWSTAKEARSALHDETQGLTRAVFLAQALPQGEARTLIESGLEDYVTTVATVEWPLLRAGDAAAAQRVQADAAGSLVQAVYAGQTRVPPDQAALLAPLSTAVDDLVQAGADRVAAAPASLNPPWLTAIGLLGLSLLALSTAFRFSGPRVTLVLLGALAAFVALLFSLLVEVSNPFAGGAALSPPQWRTVSTADR